MLYKLTKEDALAHFPYVWKAIADSIYCKPEDSYMQKMVKQAIEELRLQVWIGIKHGKVIGIALTTLVYHAVEQDLTLLIYAIYAAEQDANILREGYAVLNNFAAELGCTTISFFTNNPKIVQFAKHFKSHIEYHVVAPVIRSK